MFQIKIKQAIKASLLTLIATGLVACKTSPTQQSENALIFGKPKDAVTLDPADVTDGESSAVSVNIFETLVRFEDEKTTVKPWLATEWKISEDKLTWTFKLKSGVKFHDGTPLNAEAVKFNYDRQKNANNPHRHKGKFEYWNLLFHNVDSIEAPDELTVVFKLKKPDATFLTNLGVFSMGISSPAAIKKFGVDYFKNPVGTGPYKFKTWLKDEKILLQKNNEYWGDKSDLNLLIFRPIPDNSVRLLELESKSIHVLDGINPDDVERIQNNQDLILKKQAGLNVGYLAMNTLKKPFDNKKVRLAINYAINKSALIQAFFSKGQLGQVAKNPLPPTVWGYNNDIQDYEYDPGKAKELLAEAGYAEGIETTLWVMPLARPYMPQPKRIAEAIQKDLKQVGIETKIVTYDWGTYLEKLSNGEHDMAMAGWIGDNGDPDNFLYTLLDKENTKKGSAANYAFYKSEPVHELLVKAQQIYDQSERSKLYGKAQEIVHEDVPWVTLFHATQIIAMQKNVQGYKLHPVGEKRFMNVSLKPAKTH